LQVAVANAGAKGCWVMLESYFPVLLFVLVGLAFGVVPMALGRLIGPHRPGAEKLSAYECGFVAFEDARMKFDVRYYLVAILFILFDLEIAFLFPWATVFRDLVAEGQALFVFGSVMVFLAILVIGYIVEWKNGALDWE
jgi:NADH-quinone oxidoreductase subunit A